MCVCVCVCVCVCACVCVCVCRERVRVPARGSCKRREVRGMFKYAEVVPWCDWEPQEGQFVLLLTLGAHAQRGLL